jgi:predicted acetyltransferase
MPGIRVWLVQIRRLASDERLTQGTPPGWYAFSPSPASPDLVTELEANEKYYVDSITMIAEENGEAVVSASMMPMRQNVRGHVVPMAGLAGVASLPQVRRRGLVRQVLNELLGQVRDSGFVVSAQYPFRPSFYERFGYVGVTKARTARFDPAGLTHLQRADLPGEVTWGPIGEGYDHYRALALEILPRRHGFSVLPDSRDVYARDKNAKWLATARVDGKVVGAVAYVITGHGGTLQADDLLVTTPLSRALLLQFLARHADQVGEVSVRIAPDEHPELWATDLAVRVETDVNYPVGAAPMARVLSVEGLRGMAVGSGHVSVEIVDDPYIAGKYVLDGTSGALDITTGGDPTVTLNAAGFSGLVYGVLGPDDVGLRGFGHVPTDSAPELAGLFPRRAPYFFAKF